MPSVLRHYYERNENFENVGKLSLLEIVWWEKPEGGSLTWKWDTAPDWLAARWGETYGVGNMKLRPLCSPTKWQTSLNEPMQSLAKDVDSPKVIQSGEKVS